MSLIGSANFGGLISGLDTNQIIDDLMSIDSKPLRRLENRQTDLKKKRDTFTTMKSNLLELKNKAFELKTASSFGAFSASSSDEEALTVSASTLANEGNYSVKILSLAQAETLSGRSYEETNTDLGLSGEILINNNTLKIRATDSLIDIRNGINSLNADVTASILKVTDNDNRLIISSDTRGDEGFLISNVGGTDILGSIGFTDGTKGIRETGDGKVLSANFASANSTIGSILGISLQASGTVSIRNKSFLINLESDTLSSIRDKINDLNLSGVSAAVESVDVDGETEYRLAITGTEEFTDDGNVLETLGILEGGTTGTYAEFQTGQLLTINGAPKAATENTLLKNLGAEINETITISGTDIDGSSVSKTFIVTNDSKIEDLLSSIEETFDNNVTASVEDGRIKILSNTAGTNSLDVSINAGNEYGGVLDFGTISTVTEGRDRLLVEGVDARLLVNNIEVSRNTNEINDVLTGLSLTLKKTDVDTEINITVERDRDTIRKKVEDFVDAYNDFVDFIDENSEYNDETKEAGPLLGDLTSRTVLSRVRNVLQDTVFDGDFAYNQLVQIGIETTADGKLDIDTSKLNDAMTEDMDSVISLFTATRETSDNDITFNYHTNKTKSGTYDVTITQAAEKAVVSSDAIEDDKIDEPGTITITDNFDRAMNVDFTEGMSVTDLANSINEEADETYAEIRQSNAALKQTGGEVSITQNTAIGGIEGVTVNEGDTITIIGTNRSGRSYERIITLNGDNDTTIQDILDEIESINDNEVYASIDTEGRIQFEDKTIGESKIGLSIETTVEGLDFGVFGSIQQGRRAVNITASVTEDNRLTITHSEYGSNNTFTISGASALGIEDNEYKGVDVAGTINGYEGTGNGQSLSGASEDENTRGIIIRTTLTAAELETEGYDQGTITLIAGVADKLYSELTSLTSSIGGFVQVKIDSVELSIDSNQSRINSVNQRLELRRANYVRRFTELEQAMARLQSLQQQLNASLSSLPTTSLFSSY